MDLRVAVSRRYEHPLEATYDLATDNLRLPEIFLGFGPIAPIVKVEMIDGAAPAPGASVRIYNGDGTVLRQEIYELDRPRTHFYRLVDLKPPFAWLVRQGDSQWRFAPEGAGCRIDWQYTFALTSPAVLPLALPLVKVFMRTAMARCLDRIDAALGK